MEKQSLKTLFESGKEALAAQLSALTLPRDAQKIQSIVTEHLNKLIDGNGDFRQALTQSEDYVVQCAVSLLNAQQSMVGEFAKIKYTPQATPPHIEDTPQPNGTGIEKDQFPLALGGTAIGGAAGALVLGSWGAVFGAVAGTALVFYYASQNSTKSAKIDKQESVRNTTPIIAEQKLDVDKFLHIISGICESIDSLIETYRSQISRVVAKYENQPKPSLETNYATLLEGIQSLVGYERTHKADEEKYISKLQQRIEDLVELLDNYSLEVVDYSSNNVALFEETESPNVGEPKMVYPAITKKGEIIRKGKIFVPAKK